MSRTLKDLYPSLEELKRTNQLTWDNILKNLFEWMQEIERRLEKLETKEIIS